MDRVSVWVQRFRSRRWLQLQWVDPVTGRRHTRSAKTSDLKAARQAAADLAYELSRGIHAEPSRLAWEDFVALFTAEHLPGVRPDSRNSFRYSLAVFGRLAAPRLLAAVDVRTVSRYHAALLAANYAPATVKLHLGRLRTVLRWGRRQRLVGEVPDFPRVHVPLERPRPLAGEAFERLLCAAAGDPQALAFLRLGWDAGLRVGEAAALSWEEDGPVPWLDHEAGRIRFPAGASKSKREEWVPVAPELADALDALPGPQTGRLLRLGQGGRAVSKWAATRRFAGLCQRAGIRATYHSLRKAFGTRHAATQPLQVLQRLMRHADPSLTTRYYLNLDRAVEAAVLGAARNVPRDARPTNSGKTQRRPLP